MQGDPQGTVGAAAGLQGGRGEAPACGPSPASGSLLGREPAPPISLSLSLSLSVPLCLLGISVCQI